MDRTALIRYLPTMEIISEELTLAGWQYTTSIPNKQFSYRSVRLFTGQKELHPDILYALRPDEMNFPTDRYSYICVTPTEGSANHICCQDQSPEAVLDLLLELFYRCQNQESLIDQLCFSGGTLQDLCDLGAELFENPVFIHDDWFILLGISAHAADIMVPEYVMTSSKGFVPGNILEDFKYDSDYQETFIYPDAQLWYSPDSATNSLYVNLFDNTVYRGRFLVVQQNRDFRQSDYVLAEVFAQRAVFILQRKLSDTTQPYQSMDDLVLNLLKGTLTDPSELSHLTTMLKWNRSDSFLCIRLKSQLENENPVMDHIVHSNLFRLFPNSYILFANYEQNLILNLSKNDILPSQVPHILAPFCRDYCVYAGYSSPMKGMSELHQAYLQAGIALDAAFQLRSERWIIPFSECTLDYICSNLNSALSLEHLIAPELYTLLEYDQQNGTAYFETFRTWLLCERSIPKTSEKLFIHRTTLLYRLEKIESLFGIKTDDPWNRLYLMLSLWILENKKVES